MAMDLLVTCTILHTVILWGLESEYIMLKKHFWLVCVTNKFCGYEGPSRIRILNTIQLKGSFRICIVKREVVLKFLNIWFTHLFYILQCTFNVSVYLTLRVLGIPGIETSVIPLSWRVTRGCVLSHSFSLPWVLSGPCNTPILTMGEAKLIHMIFRYLRLAACFFRYTPTCRVEAKHNNGILKALKLLSVGLGPLPLMLEVAILEHSYIIKTRIYVHFSQIKSTSNCLPGETPILRVSVIFILFHLMLPGYFVETSLRRTYLKILLFSKQWNKHLLMHLTILLKSNVHRRGQETLRSFDQQT